MDLFFSSVLGIWIYFIGFSIFPPGVGRTGREEGLLHGACHKKMHESCWKKAPFHVVSLLSLTMYNK